MNIKRVAYGVLGCLVFFVMASAAKANTITLTFEGLQNGEPIDNYYNGGFGGDGSGPGPNYGITFSSNSLALISELDGGTGNFTNNPSGDTVAFFLTGSGDVMNVAAGFTTGFSFFYSGNSAQGNGSVDVYSGLNGTGTLLASFSVNTSLTPLCSSVPQYCVWEADGVSFSGTAESVVFGGAADYIGWDNITLGSSTPTGVTPEPASLILLGTGLLGLALVRRSL